MKAFINSIMLLLCLAGVRQVEAQVPLLNSLPTASATIFLDFDGHTVTGTSWNYNGPIVCAPSGLDNNQIMAVFNRVAEDYRPFNVNITTDSTKFLSAPAAQRMRVIETTTYQWYGQAGGVAFIGSFTWGDDSPCFVFTGLLNYNPKNIAEATSHEAGHTLSLQHQSVYDNNCVKTAEYNAGTGSGEIGWAPIMGVGYYQNVTTWNNGKSTVHCDSIQNDLQILTTSNGFGYRPDDYGDTFGTANYAPFTNNAFLVDGLITQNSDKDMFRFNQPANGRFLLYALPNGINGTSGSNLDMQVSLYNNAQSLIKVYNPDNLLSVTIDTVLTAGNYYLKVESGSSLYAPNYALLGEYTLNGSFTASTLPLRKLELSGAVSGQHHKLNWIIEADEQVTKQVLEVSIDGINFKPLIEAATIERTFTYQPYEGLNLQYRLNVEFDNGRQHYSNVIMLKNPNDTRAPKLTGNIISANLVISSPDICDYTIFEMSGRLVTSGKLASGRNTLPAGSLNKGLYIIRFTNGAAQWTEKFIRQ